MSLTCSIVEQVASGSGTEEIQLVDLSRRTSVDDAVRLRARQLDFAADQIGLSAGSVLQFQAVAEQILFTG